MLNLKEAKTAADPLISPTVILESIAVKVKAKKSAKPPSKTYFKLIIFIIFIEVGVFDDIILGCVEVWIEDAYYKGKVE